MKRWILICILLYFLVLLVRATLNIPREATRPWFWIWTGSIVFMAVLGVYFDGNASQEELMTVGASHSCG
ncbi:hypothetical protein [Thermococcus guaymasensis]|uniref:hypothetical protein n=1 Tax=Thermococcus guaymasensis TaxID=110164 RepID=UPI001FDFCB22|nr:hypothetical protein [Thermococcus guaymasensis]